MIRPFVVPPASLELPSLVQVVKGVMYDGPIWPYLISSGSSGGVIVSDRFRVVCARVGGEFSHYGLYSLGVGCVRMLQCKYVQVTRAHAACARHRLAGCFFSVPMCHLHIN